MIIIAKRALDAVAQSQPQSFTGGIVVNAAQVRGGTAGNGGGAPNRIVTLLHHAAGGISDRGRLTGQVVSVLHRVRGAVNDLAYLCYPAKVIVCESLRIGTFSHRGQAAQGSGCRATGIVGISHAGSSVTVGDPERPVDPVISKCREHAARVLNTTGQ